MDLPLVDPANQINLDEIDAMWRTLATELGQDPQQIENYIERMRYGTQLDLSTYICNFYLDVVRIFEDQKLPPLEVWEHLEWIGNNLQLYPEGDSRERGRGWVELHRKFFLEAYGLEKQ